MTAAISFPKITILGSGGAFDVQEGNSSFLIPVGGENLLMDCGCSVYTRLKLRNLVDKVDAVCITHMHDDHIGSLSTLIYDRWHLHGKMTRIVSTEIVLQQLSQYLSVAGHVKEHLHFNSRGPNVRSFPTHGKHVAGMASCGFILYGDTNIVYSGDIGCPISEVLGLQDLPSKNTIILHEATTLTIPEHCHYSRLDKLAKEYTVYAYHHNANQEDEILGVSENLNTVALLPQ